MFAAQAWAPTVYTLPLSPDFPSDGPRLIQLVERYWRTPDGALVRLDEWQKALLVHLLERYPADHPDPLLAGRLRYRQVVVSMGRQNGKSLIGGVLSLYGLLQHVRGPSVIGVATSVDQANVIYQRTAYAVKNEAALSKRLKATGTRGIRHRDGSGAYQVKPALEEGLQSVPITLGIADELHLSKASMWDSIVNGQRAQADGLLIGITTAGDDQSLLLKRLYAQGIEAAESPAGRFGFFLWEAPEGSNIDTPGAIEAANPAVACGRIPARTVRSDVRALPVSDQERYTLNRFVASINAWIPTSTWMACATGWTSEDLSDRLVFGIDRTSAWEHAVITVAAKKDGVTFTKVMRMIAKPTQDLLLAYCTELAEIYAPAFVVDTFALPGLANALKDRGHEVWKLSRSEQAAAAANGYAKIIRREMSHPGDDLLKRQMAIAARKNSGEGFVIAPTDNPVGVDGVRATVMAMYVAEMKGEESRLYVA
jgi:hypothetical protein